MQNNYDKTLEFSNLKDYSVIFLFMNPKISNPVKCLILSILESKVFDVLNKSRKDFIVSVLWPISYIPKSGKSTYGRVNYWSGVAGAAKWGINQEYRPAPGDGNPLVKIDPALIVTPPKGLEVGYVPIVTQQGLK